MTDFSSGPSDTIEPERQNISAKRQRKPGLVLAAIAVALVQVLGFWLLRSLGRLNRQMAQLSQQTERLNGRVERAEQQSGSFAQQASQTAASAQAAAHQSDEAQ